MGLATPLEFREFTKRKKPIQVRMGTSLPALVEVRSRMSRGDCCE
uniref:Uncharacterized protein n=1 Tax=Arundo donax TaxID=35708 RepID=A0A0A9E2T1_ARUDO